MTLLIILLATLAVSNVLCCPLVYGYALAQHRADFPFTTKWEPGSDVRYARLMAGLTLVGGPLVLALHLWVFGGSGRGMEFK